VKNNGNIGVRVGTDRNAVSNGTRYEKFLTDRLLEMVTERITCYPFVTLFDDARENGTYQCRSNERGTSV